MSKLKVAFFDFACCEGCQLQVYNLEEEILDLLELIEPVEWREAMTDQSDDYDVAIIEGSITRIEDENASKQFARMQRYSLRSDRARRPEESIISRTISRCRMSRNTSMGKTPICRISTHIRQKP